MRWGHQGNDVGGTLTRVTFVTKVEYFATLSNISEMPKCPTHITDMHCVHPQIRRPQQLYKCTSVKWCHLTMMSSHCDWWFITYVTVHFTFSPKVNLSDTVVSLLLRLIIEVSVFSRFVLFVMWNTSLSNALVGMYTAWLNNVILGH